MECYPDDDLDACVEDNNIESEIKKIYHGSHVLLTGATGFMGKVLLEKILRTCSVGQIYLLLREKKGKSQSERLKELLHDPVFERMLLENRNARQSITLISGDCSLPELGLSEENRRIICEKVDFVFHAAATVNMAEHLRTAFCINISATRYLLELAKTMTKLKAFIHISTAYSQVMLNVIDEEFYPTVYTAEELEQIVKAMDDTRLTAITPFLVGNCENTYSFTKGITEYMLSKYHPELPVAVARPSIVIPTAREPIVGWVDNIYGATGVSAGTMAGLLRVWRSDPNATADLIPADIAINTILAVGWHIATNRPKLDNKIVFNLVSSIKKPITWQEYMDYNVTTGFEEQLATMVGVGCYDLRLVKNATLFWIYTVVLHLIPAVFFDAAMKLARTTPKFLRAYRKVYRMNNTIACYCTKEFQYSDDNVDEVWAMMNAKDKELFNFDQTTYSYKQYFSESLKGIRVYLFKDPMETLDEARKRYYLLYYMYIGSRILIFFTALWLVYKIICLKFM